MNETTDLSIDMPSVRLRQVFMIFYAAALSVAANNVLVTGVITGRMVGMLAPIGAFYTINFFCIFLRVNALCPERRWSMTTFYFLKGQLFLRVWAHMDAYTDRIRAQFREEDAQRARDAERTASAAKAAAQAIAQQREARMRSVLLALGCRTDEMDRLRSILDAMPDQAQAERLDAYGRARGLLDAAPDASIRSRVLALLLEGNVRMAHEEITQTRAEAEAQRERTRALQHQRETLCVMRARVEALSTTEHRPEAQRLLAQVEAQVAAKPRAFRLALHPLERFLRRVHS